MYVFVFFSVQWCSHWRPNDEDGSSKKHRRKRNFVDVFLSTTAQLQPLCQAFLDNNNAGLLLTCQFSFFANLFTFLAHHQPRWNFLSYLHLHAFLHHWAAFCAFTSPGAIGGDEIFSVFFFFYFSSAFLSSSPSELFLPRTVFFWCAPVWTTTRNRRLIAITFGFMLGSPLAPL